MGLISSLLDIGVRVETAALQVGTRLGKVPLQWPAGESGSLVYRLPRDPHTRASLFASTQPIIVNEGELAVVLEDGKARGALEPGNYLFEKKPLVGSVDVVWVKSGQRCIKWGVGNISSVDGIQVSGNGVVYLRVVDALAFNAEVVQGATTLTDVDVQRFVVPRIQGVLRPLIAKWQALELQTQREVFVEGVRTALDEAFAKMGIRVEDFEVLDVNFPPEFKEVIARAAMARHSGVASVLQAQTNAQIAQIDAAAQAQAQLAAGQAQIQIMAAMQSVGVDPLKLKALEALQTFAATASPAGLLVGGDSAKAQLFGQVAAAALAGSTLGPSGLTGEIVKPAPASNQPEPPLQLSEDNSPATPPQDPGSSAPQDTVAGLSRQLDQLTERLAEGNISEEIYTKLAGRLEARLERLRS